MIEEADLGPPRPELPPRTILLALGAWVAGYAAAVVGSVAGYLATGSQLAAFVVGDIGLAATVLLACRWVARRHGSGSFREDYGFEVWPSDLWRGVLLFVGATIVAGVLMTPFLDPEDPPTSNTDVILAVSDTPVGLVLLLVATVVVAPLLEEVFFRGLVLRALASKLAAPLANLGQAVVFGLVHVDPTGGYDNGPVVIRAFVLGLAFGAVAQRTGRLGPGIAGHVVTNAAAMGVTLASA